MCLAGKVTRSDAAVVSDENAVDVWASRPADQVQSVLCPVRRGTAGSDSMRRCHRGQILRDGFGATRSTQHNASGSALVGWADASQRGRIAEPPSNRPQGGAKDNLVGPVVRGKAAGSPAAHGTVAAVKGAEARLRHKRPKDTMEKCRWSLSSRRKLASSLTREGEPGACAS